MIERVLVGLEMQIPYESRTAFETFLNFVDDFTPDRIVVIGDFLDVPGPSRWNRGTAMEFAGSLQRECKRGEEYLSRLRRYAGDSVRIDFHEGNHEKRIRNYVNNKAPAFAGLEALRIPSLLGFDKLGINLLPDVSPLARGWITTHGDSVSSTVRPTAGVTALGQARKVGKSVVCGHTHRLGQVSETTHGMTLTGIETGHMMDVKKASYVQYPNWQSGFAAFEIEDKVMRHVRLVRLDNQGRICS